MMLSSSLCDRYLKTRAQSEALCVPLFTEDYVTQGMEDVSPPKWNLAHTSWFFETCILKKYVSGYKLFDPFYHQLFNSYYQAVGKPFTRANRGLLSRPSVKEIYNYRQYIDEHMLQLMKNIEENQVISLIELGIQHEQQHQELLLMDLKYNFSLNPMFPAYLEQQPQIPSTHTTLKFIEIEECITLIGADAKAFCFDNELPRHRVLIEGFSIANRLITNEEYMNFIEDGGYKTPTLWLSDGWDWCVNHQIKNPLYWHKKDNEWYEFSLFGLNPLMKHAPVSHISFYEAEAFARWSNARLPTEEEWEHAVVALGSQPDGGNFLEQMILQPYPADPSQKTNPYQFFGDLWEWTSSAYSPYTGYQPLKGMVAEYNGKFMNNQRVLKGGCCLTPQTHIRVSYRNFFGPDKRWPFCGIRLAKNKDIR